MASSDHTDRERRAGRTHPKIPLYRQVIYSGFVMLVVLACAELICRWVLAATPNARWNYHANLVQTIGFGGLNEILEPEPERFWRVRPDLDRIRLTGRIADSGPISFTVSTDDKGHRLMPEVPNARASVLFLGDSCTFGIGVDDDQTFPAVLQRGLTGLQCINAGAPGYSAYQGRVALESMSFETPPDAVVVSFMFNDDSGWDGLGDSAHAEALGRPVARWIRRFRLLGFLASLKPSDKTAPSDRRSQRPRLTDGEYADELRRIARRCRATGSEPVFVVWPMMWQMTGPQRIAKQDVMRRVAGEESVRLLDLVPLFRSRGSASLFADVIHASPAGNRLVAEALEPVIRGLLRTGPVPARGSEAPAESPRR